MTAIFVMPPPTRTAVLHIRRGKGDIFVSPAKQRRDICIAFPASASSSAAA